jgi:hypothetical protein
MDNRCSIAGRRWEFFSLPPRPDRLWGPSSLLSNGNRGLFPRVKRPRHEANHTPSSPKVKNTWSSTSVSAPHVSSWRGTWYIQGQIYVKVQAFLTSTLDGDEWSASRPGPRYPLGSRAHYNSKRLSTSFEGLGTESHTQTLYSELLFRSLAICTHSMIYLKAKITEYCWGSQRGIQSPKVAAAKEMVCFHEPQKSSH